MIYTSVREWIIKMTDIKLSTQVDMSCAMYSYTGEEDKQINWFSNFSNLHTCTLDLVHVLSLSHIIITILLLLLNILLWYMYSDTPNPIPPHQSNWYGEVLSLCLQNSLKILCSSDVLSCHDDELDDRRVAFIYYLVPESWNAEDGGRLQLFSLDGIGTILEHLRLVESFSMLMMISQM